MISARTGYARLTHTYNAQGNVHEESYRGVDNRPMLQWNQYAKVTFHYDDAGYLTDAIRWDLVGKQVPPAQVTIREVDAGSHAAEVGIQIGDIVTAYDGDAVPNTAFLEERLQAKGAKYRSLEIRRAGQTRHFELKPGRLGIVAEDKVSEAAPLSER